MEIPTDMFDWPVLKPPLQRFEWAILYLPHATEEPFMKLPLVYDTYLGAISSIGLSSMGRYEIHRGDVSYNVYSTFKVYMLIHKGFMRHVDNIVDIANMFYKYCFASFDPNMSNDTAYCLCTSILPPVTRAGYEINLLLTALELKDITGSTKDLKEIEAVSFEPLAEPENVINWRAKEDAVRKYVAKQRLLLRRMPPVPPPTDRVYVEGFDEGGVQDPRLRRGKVVSPQEEVELSFLQYREEPQEDVTFQLHVDEDLRKEFSPKHEVPQDPDATRPPHEGYRIRQGTEGEPREATLPPQDNPQLHYQPDWELESESIHIDTPVIGDLDEFEEIIDLPLVSPEIPRLPAIPELPPLPPIPLQPAVPSLKKTSMQRTIPKVRKFKGIQETPTPEEGETGEVDPVVDPVGEEGTQQPQEVGDPTPMDVQEKGGQQREEVADPTPTDVQQKGGQQREEVTDPTPKDVQQKGGQVPEEPSQDERLGKPGPTKSEFDEIKEMVLKLQKENKNLKKRLSSKRRYSSSSSSSSSSEESSDVDKDDKTKGNIFHLDPLLKRQYKQQSIKEALPFDNNESILSVLDDKEGEVILRHILQKEIRQAIREEYGTFDTAMKSRVLAHKVVNTLFSSKYRANLKFFDPRPDYNQKQGTAMVQPVYTFFHDILCDMSSEHYRELGQENRFDWAQMLVKLREVWRWARNNMKKKEDRSGKKAKRSGKKKAKK